MSALASGTVYRCAPPAGMSSGLPVVAPPLIDSGPDWTSDGRTLSWVQGGRLCVLDVASGEGRVATPPDLRVRTVVWSASPGRAALEGVDGQLVILDSQRSILVPLHAGLPQLIPVGDVLWSPSGRRLLFRAAGGVSSANFVRPSAAARWARRALAAVTGRPRPPEPSPVVGDYRDRLVLFDLAGQRLESLPLEYEPGAIDRVTGAVWAPDENTAYLGAHSRDASFALWRVRVEGMRAEAVLRSRDPILPLALDPRRVAVVEGDRVRFFDPDRGVTEPASSSLARYPLVTDALGTCQDEEGSYLTAERAPSVLIADAGRIGLALPARRVSEGSYASLDAGSPMATAFRRLVKQGGILDADLAPASGKVVACVSTNGGVGELKLVDASGREQSLSRSLVATTPAVIEMRVAPYPMVGARTGMEMLASDPRRSHLLVLSSVIAVLLIAGGVTLRRRRRPL